ncbi:hypothetical protein DNH61_13095 [Paenibacillus sambharensis]|uniref:Uncharacterized protein n=1 Tax=Paenibacillus sambharensis TaxID=1803190 RepID=A0A2W1LKP2_9BACL|nr:hypothetical protein [Paenibacillus sambharensis]PZD95465.1 hypothetical protein DNH61_13095 [Paenibacillus sambharensis]
MKWQLTGLLRLDAKQAVRDPMLGLALCAPVLLLIVLRFGLPAAGQLLEAEFGIQLVHYEPLLLAFFLQLVPLMLGMLTGFVMLEERDERLIGCYAVTPLGKRGYLVYRLLLPFILSLLFTAILLLAGGLGTPSAAESAAAIMLYALQTPLFALVLTAWADNKVEGLALSKAAGITVFTPAAVAFIPWPWQLAAGVIPSYWPVRLMMGGVENGGADGWLHSPLSTVLMGLIVTGGWLVAVFAVFERKVEHR